MSDLCAFNPRATSMWSGDRVECVFLAWDCVCADPRRAWQHACVRMCTRAQAQAAHAHQCWLLLAVSQAWDSEGLVDRGGRMAVVSFRARACRAESASAVHVDDRSEDVSRETVCLMALLELRHDMCMLDHRRSLSRLYVERKIFIKFRDSHAPPRRDGRVSVRSHPGAARASPGPGGG